MMRQYQYVGPPEILEASKSHPPGCRIKGLDDLLFWLVESQQEPDISGHLIATYVVGTDGDLYLADRHSEHVACAARKPVLAAGEIFFCREGQALWVDEISNQSTGYCPDVDCWPAIAAALERIPLEHPGRLTRAFVFRFCTACQQRNVVKEGWLVCDLCDAPLSESWNFARVGGL